MSEIPTNGPSDPTRDNPTPEKPRSDDAPPVAPAKKVARTATGAAKKTAGTAKKTADTTKKTADTAKKTGSTTKKAAPRKTAAKKSPAGPGTGTATSEAATPATQTPATETAATQTPATEKPAAEKPATLTPETATSPSATTAATPAAESGASASPTGKTTPAEPPPVAATKKAAAKRTIEKTTAAPTAPPTETASEGRPRVATEAPQPAPSAPVAAETPTSGNAPLTSAETHPPASQDVSPELLERLAGGAHHDPHSILGPHPSPDGVTLRVLKPWATSVSAVVGENQYPLQHEHAGIWVGTLPGPVVPDYRLDVAYDNGEPARQDDPYRFLPTLGELDLHLIGEGRHERLWTVLGAHVRTYDSINGPITGTSFAVWAPNARGVRVVGDFNFWDGRAHPMRGLGSSGVWEIFVPGVVDGAHYKFEILGADGVWRQKADPLAFLAETPPATASVVFTSTYEWGDDDWMRRRSEGSIVNRPMSVYEVHLGSWRAERNYREMADELAEYVGWMGFTHVEFLPVSEHPFGGSWGYQVTSYYAPTSRFGDPDDFRYLVDRLHQAGIGILVDWVPAHFPKDAWALARFDGTALYEHADPRRGEQPDWGTLVFDFGRYEVRNFLVANALYWLEDFHIDGLRVDAVASMLYLDYSRPEGQWLPNQYGGRENLDAVAFLQEMNATAYRRVPGIMTIAEESTSWPGVTRQTHLGGLGFGFKWNMGWMHDSLAYMSTAPVYRSYHHHQLTFSMMYAYSENFVLPISHDEVVHGKGSLLRKMPGDRWQQLANLRAFLAFMWAHPGKQLLFMGQEFAQESEWSESRTLDWWLTENPDHRGIQSLVRDLNSVYRATGALWDREGDPASFQWIDANDADNNTFSFLRRGADGSVLACIANFAGVPHEGYRVGLPEPGTWKEVLNTDSELYSGSGVGNLGAVEAEEEPWHGQPASVTLRVPPLGAVWLYRSAEDSATSAERSASAGDEKSSTPSPEASSNDADLPSISEGHNGGNF